VAIYAPSPNDGTLRQGELLSALIQVRLSLATVVDEPEAPEFETIVHPFAIVVSQDCDLDWDFKARQRIAEIVEPRMATKSLN
jgi:hypothetical protein